MADAVKSLDIALGMTNEAALQAVQSLKQRMRAVHQELLTEEQIAERAQTEFIKRENAQRIAEAAKQKKTTVELDKEAAENRKRLLEEIQRSQAQLAKELSSVEKQTASERKQFAKEIATEATKWTKHVLAEEKQAAKETADARKRLMAEIAESQKKLTRELSESEKQWKSEAKAASRDLGEQQKAEYDSWMAQHLRKRNAVIQEKKVQEEAHAATSATVKAALAFVGLQSGFSAINKVIGAIAENTNRVAENMLKSGDAYREFRRKTLELQSVEGKPVTAESVRQTAEGAAKAGIDPNYFVDFKRMMNEEAIGTVAEPKVGQPLGAGQFTQQQYDEIVQKAAKFSQARGLKGDDVSKLMGSLMRNSKAGSTVDDIVKQFGEIFNILEVAPGATQLLMPEFVQALATGMDAKSAAKATAVAAEKGRPKESGAVADAFGRAIRNMFVRDEGKQAEEFGLTANESDFQSLQKIYEKAKKEGVDFSNPKQFGVWLGKHGITEQESINAIQTYINKGIIGGGFKRADERMGQDGLKVFGDTIARFANSEEGRSQKIEAEKKAGEITGGEDDRFLKDYYNQAEGNYRKSGRDKQTTAGDFLRSMMSPLFGSVEQQLIRREAVRLARQKAREAGVKGVPEDTELTNPAEMDNREILELDKKIRDRQAMSKPTTPEEEEEDRQYPELARRRVFLGLSRRQATEFQNIEAAAITRRKKLTPGYVDRRTAEDVRIFNEDTLAEAYGRADKAGVKIDRHPEATGSSADTQKEIARILMEIEKNTATKTAPLKDPIPPTVRAR